MSERSRISVLMERLGWRQVQMAEALGMSQANISRMASGAPERGAARKLLDALAIEGGHPDLTAERFTWNKSGTTAGDESTVEAGAAE